MSLHLQVNIYLKNLNSLKFTKIEKFDLKTITNVQLTFIDHPNENFILPTYSLNKWKFYLFIH